MEGRVGVRVQAWVVRRRGVRVYQPLDRLNRHILVVEFGAPFVRHVVEVSHEHCGAGRWHGSMGTVRTGGWHGA
eukprot:1533069-Prymnesium_polylepis.1